MASIYYDQTKVKSDLNLTTTSKDTQLDHWSDEAESEIDDTLYNLAVKARRLTKLPVLPFASGSVPETVQGASDHLVKARYYEFIKDRDMASHHQKKADAKLQLYIDRLATDKIIYGRIAR